MTNEHGDARLLLRGLYISIVIIIIGAALILIINSTLEAPSRTRVGAVFSGRVTESGWNGANYSGLSSACKAQDTELIICENVPEDRTACFNAMAKLVEQNCKAVFLTSYGYANYADEMAAKYPTVKFYVSGSDREQREAVYYFGRMYQVRYLAGIIAGLTTKTGTIGYVAAMPNNEVNRGINAFTLGVRRFAPKAQVRVIFTGSWDNAKKEKDAVNRLAEQSADVITYHQNRESVPEACEAAGIDYIGMYELAGEYSSHHLTSIMCRWSKIYSSLLRDMRVNGEGDGRICWLGIEDDAVELDGYSGNVSLRARTEVSMAIDELKAGKFIFSGEIYDNSGVLRCADDEVLSDRALLYGMDWFAEGVVIDEAK